MILWPLIAAVISLATHTNYFIGALLLFGVPGLYLSILIPKTAFRVAFASLLALPIPFITDYIAHVGKAWYVFADSKWRILGGSITFVDIAWFFMWIFCILMVWEYFFDDSRTKQPWSKRTPTLARILVVALIIFFTMYLIVPHLLVLPYAYVWIVVLLVIPPIALELWHHPRLAPKLFWITFYFAYAILIHELVALQLGFWMFPGTQYIGWLQLFQFRIPLEEVITFILLGTATCICCYEYYLDDDR